MQSFKIVWKWFIVIIAIFCQVAENRTVLVEIVHDETYASEEFEEQEVIPSVNLYKGDELLHVIKLGVFDQPEPLNIQYEHEIQFETQPPVVTDSSNDSIVLEVSETNNKKITNDDEKTDNSQSTRETLPQTHVTQEGKHTMSRDEKSRLLLVLTGRNLSYVNQVSDGNVLPETESYLDNPSVYSSSQAEIEDRIDALSHTRQKRQVGLDVDDLANEGWVYQHTTPVTNRSRNGTDEKEEDGFQIITEEDRENATKAQIRTILLYTGSTLLTVLMFTGITFCFLRDPKACIVAFGTGCPCLLFIFPCIMKCLDKYLNPAKMVKENLNKYLPGVIIHDDGTIEKYETSPEEIECITDIIDEVMNM